jgi:hypothetical protein
VVQAATCLVLPTNYGMHSCTRPWRHRGGGGTSSAPTSLWGGCKACERPLVALACTVVVAHVQQPWMLDSRQLPGTHIGAGAEPALAAHMSACSMCQVPGEGKCNPCSVLVLRSGRAHRPCSIHMPGWRPVSSTCSSQLMELLLATRCIPSHRKPGLELVGAEAAVCMGYTHTRHA